jgi:hypothetical protein
VCVALFGFVFFFVWSPKFFFFIHKMFGGGGGGRGS